MIRKYRIHFIIILSILLIIALFIKTILFFVIISLFVIFLQYYFRRVYKLNFISLHKFKNLMKSKKCKYKIQKVNINTFDGSGSVTHPSVVEYNNICWMVFTPYDNCNINLENPSIAFSTDLLNFIKPNNVLDPLLPIIKNDTIGEKKYYNDPYIRYENGFEIYYRYTEEINNEINNKLYVIKSKNGEDWDLPDLVIEEDDTYMSPTVLKINNYYYLFYFNKDNQLSFKTSIDKKNWSNSNLIFNKDIIPWHGELMFYKNKLIFIFIEKGTFDLFISYIDLNKKEYVNVKKINISVDTKGYYSNSIKYKTTFLLKKDNLILYIPIRYDKINLCGKKIVTRKWILYKVEIPKKDII